MSYNAIKKENKKKKRCQSLLIFQTRDLGHHTQNTIHEKNYKAQSLGNATLKDD
jgi:hypothetical protein